MLISSDSPHSLVLEDLQLELEDLKGTGAALMGRLWEDIPHTCICLARGELDLDSSPINHRRTRCGISRSCCFQFFLSPFVDLAVISQVCYPQFVHRGTLFSGGSSFRGIMLSVGLMDCWPLDEMWTLGLVTVSGMSVNSMWCDRGAAGLNLRRPSCEHSLRNSALWSLLLVSSWILVAPSNDVSHAGPQGQG